jgi:Histidine kinase-, DNA gyrase B-, and HSP90-like ATPase
VTVEDFPKDSELVGSTDSSENLEIRPGVGLWALFRTMRYTSWVALGELVDNSIGSYVANKDKLIALHGEKYRLRVDITFVNGSNPEIQVKDNAAGISTNDVKRAFTPALPPVDRSGINQYGIGMKSSACWYANFFTVKSRAIGEPFARIVTFDIPKIIKEQTEIVKPIKELVSNEKYHGTSIIMRNLNQPIPVAGAASRVRSYLKSMYRDFIRTGELILTINNEKLEPDVVTYLKAPYWPNSLGPGTGPELEWVKSFEIELNESFVPSDEKPNPPKIRGKVGILSKGDTKKAGLALLWKRRVVQGAGNLADSPDDLYRPPILFGSSNAYRKQRLIGELDVSELTVTSFKDALVWSYGQEEEALKKIKKILDAEPAPMLKMAENFRISESSKPVVQHVEKTVNDVVTSVTKSILDGAEGEVGAPFPELITQEPPEPESNPGSESLSKTILLVPNYEQDFVLEVKDQSNDLQWLRVKRDENENRWVFTVNRAHPFMLSFTVANPDALEPVLRLALSIGIAEVQGINSGYETASVMRLAVNEILRQYLSQKTDATLIIEDE